jgi:ergothioneine biosynthesis protein EgtB
MTAILEKYLNTRRHTLHLCAGLEPEDYNLQGAEFTSPVKWHLAHTTWFFEEMILKNFLTDYKLFNDQFAFLFNSYYNTLGERVLRKNRGLLSRPYITEVFEYRTYVDQHIEVMLKNIDDQHVLELVNLGIQHEEQHQELLQTDVKYSLSLNPINFISNGHDKKQNTSTLTSKGHEMKAGIYEIGYNGNGFCYDNELNKHKVYLDSFEISKNLVTNKEYFDFIEAGGYSNFNYWLDEGWEWIKSIDGKAPLYWRKNTEGWMHYTLEGLAQIDPNDYLNHISYYEAMAFAAWRGKRLPTEFEWEAAADHIQWGSRWEWTNSAYLPYPGFKIAAGAVGEYNGKFMSNQMVLRGASIATSNGHSRKSYRNFFHPSAQWQFAGLRLVNQ